MSDQGLWFKLWVAALDDPDLDNLDIADFGRWAKLGAFVKRHGTDGTVIVQAPARALCAMLQIGGFEALIAACRRLPKVRCTPTCTPSCTADEQMVNTAVSSETIVAVTFDNWAKYQGDFSTHRVRRFREMKRSKRRGEETRGEENPPLPPVRVRHAAPPHAKAGLHPDGFVRFWTEYPRHVGKPRASSAWRTLQLEPVTDAVLAGLTRWRAWWTRQQTPGDRIPYPASWLNDRRWEDSPVDPLAQPSHGLINLGR